MRTHEHVKYGYMNTVANRLFNESAQLHDVDFIEIQVHDALKNDYDLIRQYQISPSFGGFVTIHGEGETRGGKKIMFASESDKRKTYVKESVQLYTSILSTIGSEKVKRLVVHPDTLNRKISRNAQIRYLADSLIELNDNLNLQICIEPRGGTRHGKVLRLDMEDITSLEDCLGNQNKKIGLCIDIAQLFVVYGNTNSKKFLEDLRLSHLPVHEFHLSDVMNHEKIQNRTAMEIGKGSVNWISILPSVLSHNNDLLIETIGGIGVFERSRDYLQSLVNTNEILL